MSDVASEASDFINYLNEEEEGGLAPQGGELRKRAGFSSKSVDTIAGLNACEGDSAAAGVQQLASAVVGGVVALHDG